ncbi:hypothetical protein N7449_003884 [Penicillium cf. viridicatum]|uniref:Uncharacterized protein n=1 Tax=Penicillium cf. viridicatum TaxID=2972119 RepID=A0A9W9MY82_9EURO|nr:hypothetical protein N7449_003884 [Penicillium cf. viridicatum]
MKEEEEKMKREMGQEERGDKRLKTLPLQIKTWALEVPTQSLPDKSSAYASTLFSHVYRA